jgi:hypothetical protein
MPDVMNERRRDRRLDEFHDITISVISAVNNLPTAPIFYNYCDDISASGTRIHANSFLPVDTLLQLDIIFENLQQMLTTRARVKWARVVSRDRSCEAGVQFSTPSEITQIHMMPLPYLYAEALRHLYA